MAFTKTITEALEAAKKELEALQPAYNLFLEKADKLQAAKVAANEHGETLSAWLQFYYSDESVDIRKRVAKLQRAINQLEDTKIDEEHAREPEKWAAELKAQLEKLQTEAIEVKKKKKLLKEQIQERKKDVTVFLEGTKHRIELLDKKTSKDVKELVCKLHDYKSKFEWILNKMTDLRIEYELI